LIDSTLSTIKLQIKNYYFTKVLGEDEPKEPKLYLPEFGPSIDNPIVGVKHKYGKITGFIFKNDADVIYDEIEIKEDGDIDLEVFYHDDLNWATVSISENEVIS